ncbi:ribonuclease HI, putative [Rhizophagus clarus]|uniref:Ribonuclease HI, putative n=1 Tax=Rhizophagus clarus TaxID=94130 RepID=A0A8H3QZ57_9GLOM|nr:ribonuclease HI, putative [Rhizophagus clarus]
MEIIDECWADIKETLILAAAHTLPLRKQKTLHPKLNLKDRPLDLKKLDKHTLILLIFVHEITAAVEARFVIIQSDQTRWISSSLDRRKPNVTIDRLMVTTEDGLQELLLHLDEIKQAITNVYASQFKKRNHQLNLLDAHPIWKKAYEPILDADNFIYESMDNNFTLTFWHKILKDINKTSAPGTSDKFEYNMFNIRPIALLEVVRKIFTKFINTQFTDILQDHNILCNTNYCGLKGKSTASSIRLINNIIEDAKENSKELWIVFQNISKAFDSISLDFLELALNCIGLPHHTVRCIINLFKGRNVQVTTAFRPSSIFQAEDGIDQGDRTHEDDTIHPIQTKTQYLGVWISPKNTRSLTNQLTTFTKPKWDAIERPILALVKHIIGVQRSFLTSALYHEEHSVLASPNSRYLLPEYRSTQSTFHITKFLTPPSQDGRQKEWIAVQADITWLIGRITNKSFDGRKGPSDDKDSLIGIKDNLSYFKELSFYTDESIQNGVPSHLRQPLDECPDHRSMVINQDAAVKIYTDSNCLILTITRFLCSRSKFCSRDFNNSLILIYIDILIKDRNLDLELIKVKAHASDPWNELADELVKKGTELTTQHQLTFNFGSQNHRFSPHFEDTLIEQKLRNFLNTMGLVQVCSEWRDLQVNEEAFIQRS